MQRKHLTKVLIPFQEKKNINEQGIEGKIKDVCEKPVTPDVTFNGEILNGSPQDQEQDTKSILIIPIQHRTYRF